MQQCVQHLLHERVHGILFTPPETAAEDDIVLLFKTMRQYLQQDVVPMDLFSEALNLLIKDKSHHVSEIQLNLVIQC